MKKICTKCKIPKMPREFHKYERSPDGLCYECKNCKNKRNEKYIKKDWLKVLIG